MILLNNKQNSKVKIILLVLALFFFTKSYSQLVFGELINLDDKLTIRADSTVIIVKNFNSNSQKNILGHIYDTLIILNNRDTVILKKYINEDWYYLIFNKKTCNQHYKFFYLIEEYWPNGNTKQEVELHFFKNKGYLKHGKTKKYNKYEEIICIEKYRKGKLYGTYCK